MSVHPNIKKHNMNPYIYIAQLAGAVEYIICIFGEG